MSSLITDGGKLKGDSLIVLNIKDEEFESLSKLNISQSRRFLQYDRAKRDSHPGHIGSPR